MERENFKLYGRVLDSANAGVADLRMVLTDSVTAPQVLLYATADNEGGFVFDVSEADLNVLFSAPSPDLWTGTASIVVAAYNGTQQLATQPMLLGVGDLALGRLPSDLSVTTTATLSFEVNGRVVDFDGVLRGGLTVNVERVDATSTTTIATVTTDGGGNFTTTYAGVAESTPTATNMAIRVIADSMGTEVGRTAVIIDPQPSHRVDIVTVTGTERYIGVTEYERIDAAVSAVTGGPAPTSSDIELVAKRANVHPERLAMYIQAQRLATHGVMAEAFYGLLRAGLPAAFPDLLAQPRAALRTALEGALAQRLIPATVVVATELATLDTRRFDAITTGTDSKIRDSIATSALGRTKEDAFFTAWNIHDGTLEEFWPVLAADPTFTTADIDTLKFTTEAAALTANYLPALTDLQTQRGAATISTVADLAAWDVPEWQTFTTAHGAPTTLPGATAAERETLYAETMNRIIEERYSTAVLARRIQRDTPPSTAGVHEFIDFNPAFDVEKSMVAVYLDDNPSAMPGGVDPVATEANLKSVQRVYSLTPRFARYAATKVLLDQGIGSGSEIVHMGKTAFIETFTPLLDGIHPKHDGLSLATVVYGAALHKHSYALAVMGQYGASFNTISTDAMPLSVVLDTQGSGATTLAELFGSLDFCACKHCRSMFGPAAYLVDLFAMLEGAPATTLANALAVLKVRRPDITGIELSCDNTNVVLPYVDIVNELLEQVELQVPLTAHQTTWSAAELRANPENTNSAAYLGAGTAVFPWSLPADVPGTEIRAYFDQLGAPRPAAMSLLQTADGLSPDPLDIVAERLGIGRVELDLIADTASTTPEAAWGMSGAGWDQVLANDLRQLLDKAAIEYDELLDLLALPYVDPSSATAIAYAGGEPSCDLDNISITGFTPAIADRIHRFVRLARRRSESWIDLDIAIRRLGGGVLDAAFLTAFVDLRAVRDRLRVDTATACALWGTIDTQGYEDQVSLYERRFLSREVLPTPDPNFALNAAGTELAVADPGPGPVIDASHYDTLRAGLGVNDTDLAALLGLFTTPTLDLATVSSMFAHVVLARGVGLSIADLLRMRTLSSIDPFVDPDATSRFGQGVADALGSGMSLDEIDYICRDQFVPESGVQPVTEVVTEIVDRVLARVGEVDAGLQMVGDEPSIMRAHLEAVFGDLAIVADWLRIFEEQVLGAVPGDANAVVLRDSLLAVPGLVADAAEADGWVNALGWPSQADPKFAARFATTITLFEDHRRRLGYDEAVAQILADAGGIEIEAARVLSLEILEDGLGPDKIRDILVDETRGRADREAAYLRFHKVALMVTGLEIRTADLSWYFVSPNTAAPQAMDPNALPVASPQLDGTGPFTEWDRIATGQRVQASFTSAENPLPSAVAAATLSAAAAELAAASSWHVDDLDWAFGIGWLNLASPADLADPDVLVQVRDAADMVRKTGVRAEQLATWARATATAADATAAKKALRSRYTDDQWPGVITPISDRMREFRREALLDFIIARGDFPDRTAVYESLLLDPEMSACMLTSRVKLALSSAQLFIQRVLMNLEETDVTFSKQLAREWKWRKNYRVWEANRKVFFYPENWVEPELRTDKSPFFRDLEAFLDQGDLTQEHVEQGYKNYLASLHEVAHLETIAIHEEVREGGGKIVHVVGRTAADPRKHFYRRRINDAFWTPWEEIDLDLQSDQVIIATLGPRVFIFWAELRKESKQEGESAAPPFSRVQLSWSEYQDGNWSRRRMVSSRKTTDGVPNPDGIMLWSVPVTDQQLLVVQVYGPRPVNDDYFVEIDSFKYDDCRDRFEATPIVPGPTHKELFGLCRRDPAGQRASAGHHVTMCMLRSTWDPDTSTSMLTGYDLVTNLPRDFYVTTTHQGEYLGVRPAVFDERNHSLWMTPMWLVPFSGDPGSDTGSWEDFSLTSTLPDGAVPDDAGSSSDPPNAALLDDVVVSVPWEGLVPGGDLSITFGEPNVDHAISTLAAAEATASASTDLAASTGVPSEPINIQFFKKWRLDTFHHPYTCKMRGAVNRLGIDGLLDSDDPDLKRQSAHWVHFVPNAPPGSPLEFQLSGYVVEPYPADDFDFTPGGAYSVYNWELFYHAPLLIADRLRREQRFEEAHRWYQYIFNPQAGIEPGMTGPARFWNVKPLHEETKNGIPDVIQTIFSTEGLDGHPDVVINFLVSVLAWTFDAFNPHAIARVRFGTYRWVAVRKYLDNLIEWGDSLFRRDSIESINEATQLYLLAAGILGARPKQLQEIDSPPKTYDELDLPALFGGFTELEGYYPAGGVPQSLVTTPAIATASSPIVGSTAISAVAPPPPPPIWWYFCLPPNDQLLAYWDRVADRLFKIRHCQNIEGVERQLALFEPPIDPALLVKARAAGLDLGAVLADLNAPLPHYRYRVLVARAIDLCNDVRALGGALLTALEKKDGEAMARLRAGHEVAVLKRVRDVRELQIEEAEAQIEALRESKELAMQRHGYYASRVKVSSGEQAQLDTSAAATNLRETEQSLQMVTGILSAIPQIQLGTGFFTHVGGQQFAAIPRAVADAIGLNAMVLEANSTRQGIMAGYERRFDDWQFQAAQAKQEITQIDKQIIAAQIRLDLARTELTNHESQTAESEEVELFLRTKYTGEELYDWMIGQLSGLYFQSYRLAYDMAKRAERTMHHELADAGQVAGNTFIEFGHWDGLRRGLLAGERLLLDLKRMEAAYLERDAREYELTKRVSLRMVAPQALLDLQRDGTCEFDLGEVLFDLDHPGHYMRRMRAVRVTIPAVAGPTTTIGAKLTLLKDTVRFDPDATAAYPIADPDPHTDSRFRIHYGGTKAIATSQARDDAGMFELNFRDDRYLPFEGAGAISRWRLELPAAFRQFDYDTISDVEIRIDYTARDGGSALRTAAETAMTTALNAALDDTHEIAVLLSAKKDFAVDWELFLRPPSGPAGGTMSIPIVLERFPYVLRGRSPAVESVELAFVSEGVAAGAGTGTIFKPNEGPPGTALTFAVANGITSASADYSAVPVPVNDQTWTVTITDPAVLATPEDIDDLLILVRFTVS